MGRETGRRSEFPSWAKGEAHGELSLGVDACPESRRIGKELDWLKMGCVGGVSWERKGTCKGGDIRQPEDGSNHFKVARGWVSMRVVWKDEVVPWGRMPC